MHIVFNLIKCGFNWFSVPRFSCKTESDQFLALSTIFTMRKKILEHFFKETTVYIPSRRKRRDHKDRTEDASYSIGMIQEFPFF